MQSLRAYIILYVIKIRWIMCVQKKLSFLACHRDQGGAQSKFQEISLLLLRKSSKTDCTNIFSGMTKKLAPFLPRWHCHPMPPHGYALDASPIYCYSPNSLLQEIGWYKSQYLLNRLYRISFTKSVISRNKSFCQSLAAILLPHAYINPKSVEQ